MIFRQLTGLGDWTFGKGISGYATAEQAIELNIRTRLQSWKGDCFFAADDFVDWLGRLDKNQETALRNELRNVLLQSLGVVGITRFTGALNRQTRHYEATYDIETIYSPSFVNGLQLAAGLSPGGAS